MKTMVFRASIACLTLAGALTLGHHAHADGPGKKGAQPTTKPTSKPLPSSKVPINPSPDPIVPIIDLSQLKPLTTAQMVDQVKIEQQMVIKPKDVLTPISLTARAPWLDSWNYMNYHNGTLLAGTDPGRLNLGGGGPDGAGTYVELNWRRAAGYSYLVDCMVERGGTFYAKINHSIRINYAPSNGHFVFATPKYTSEGQVQVYVSADSAYSLSGCTITPMRPD